jgi:hypothetical protein
MRSGGSACIATLLLQVAQQLVLAAVWGRAAVLPPLAASESELTPLCALLHCNATTLEGMGRAAASAGDGGEWGGLASTTAVRVLPHLPQSPARAGWREWGVLPREVLALSRFPLDAEEAQSPGLMRLLSRVAIVEAPELPTAGLPNAAMVEERKWGSGVVQDDELLRVTQDIHRAALARRQQQQQQQQQQQGWVREWERESAVRVNRVLRSFKLADGLRAHALRLVRALGGAGGFLALRLAPLPPMVDGGGGDSGGTAWGALEMAAWRARLQRVLQSAPFAAAVARAGETAPIVFVAVESSAGVSCHDELFQPLSDAGLRLECIPPPAPPTQQQVQQEQQQQQQQQQQQRRRRPPTQSRAAVAAEANSLTHDLVVAAVAAQSAAFVGSKSDPISRLVRVWCNGTRLRDNDIWVV